MSSDSEYIESLRNFIQDEFRSEIREKSSVIIDCLVCKLKPSTDCKVCLNKNKNNNNNNKIKEKDETEINNKLKKLSNYSSVTHFHNIKLNVNKDIKNAPNKQFVDLSGEPITEETLNNNKQMRQMRKLQNIILELRENIQKLEYEKSETIDTLKQITFVCSSMRNRQKQLDIHIQQLQEEVKERDNIIYDLSNTVQMQNEEINQLKIKCATSESCRSNTTKELKLLRQQLQKQTDYMSLFSLPNPKNYSLNNFNQNINKNLSNSKSNNNNNNNNEIIDIMENSSLNYNNENYHNENENCNDVRDNETVVSNTTSNTIRTTATINTTPVHIQRPNSAPTIRSTSEHLIYNKSNNNDNNKILLEVANNIDPKASGIGNHVLGQLIKGVSPNDLIKQNNIKKYNITDNNNIIISNNNNNNNKEAVDYDNSSIPLTVQELSNSKGFNNNIINVKNVPIKEKVTAQLLKGTSPQNLIKQNNLQRYQANILPNKSPY